jgi:hypothetical protein
MGKKPVRVNINDELDKRARQLLARSERVYSTRPSGPLRVKCRRCGGDALLDKTEDGWFYCCISCGEEFRGKR